VSVAGGVGRDPFGEAVLAELRGADLDVSNVVRCEVPTSTMLLMVELSGERTMVGTRGASERFDLDADRILNATRPGWVHVSGYTLIEPDMEHRCDALLLASEARGIPCSVDLEGIATTGRRTPLERATVLCSEAEFAAYFGGSGPASVAASRTASAPLVMKAGAAGCSLLLAGTVASVPAGPEPSEPPVDTTGAGDAFDAAFITATMHGRSPLEACRWGNAAGRMAVRILGPRAALSFDRVRAEAEPAR
jgi:sugar/nucleoside kinase (ribokinase family)